MKNSKEDAMAEGGAIFVSGMNLKKSKISLVGSEIHGRVVINDMNTVIKKNDFIGESSKISIDSNEKNEITENVFR